MVHALSIYLIKWMKYFRIADEITVFRDGAVVDSRAKEDYDMDTVITQMVGRKIESVYLKEDITLGDKVLEVKGLTNTR